MRRSWKAGSRHKGPAQTGSSEGAPPSSRRLSALPATAHTAEAQALEARRLAPGLWAIIDALGIDQSGFAHLAQCEALAGRNAQEAFSQMEWE